MSGSEILLIDAGNTRLKWAWLVDAQRSGQQAESYPADADALDAAQVIIAELLKQSTVQRLVIVHVLGDIFSAGLQQVCRAHHCELALISSAANTYGIKLAYPNPAHLGADRLVGLAAARSLAHNRAAIIIDCGTAVTVDAMTAGSQHLGGLITPGLSLLSDVLIRRTKAKHMDALSFDDPRIFTDNTAAAMGSGCLFSLVGTIEGICQRMQNQMTEQPLKIICGGDAARVHALLHGDFMLRPAALMDGLQAIAEYD